MTKEPLSSPWHHPFWVPRKGCCPILPSCGHFQDCLSRRPFPMLWRCWRPIYPAPLFSGNAGGTHAPPCGDDTLFFFCISFAHWSAGNSEIRQRWRKEQGCLIKVAVPWWRWNTASCKARDSVAMSHLAKCGSGRRLLSLGKWGLFTREKHTFSRLY